MRNSFSDEAIVLRTYDAGETDRLCVLLTRFHGRIFARAKGVRRLKSRKGGTLLPLHVVRIGMEAGKAGNYLTDAECIDANSQSWKSTASFAVAQQGIELLLRLIEEDEPVGAIYDDTVEFLQACGSARNDDIFAVFALKILSRLGLLPSFRFSSVSHRAFDPGSELAYNAQSGGVAARAEDPSARPISARLAALLREIPDVSLHRLPHLDEAGSRELKRFVYSLLGSQLGSELKALPVARSLSSDVPVSAGMSPGAAPTRK